eukprot:g11224.t1
MTRGTLLAESSRHSFDSRSPFDSSTTTQTTTRPSFESRSPFGPQPTFDPRPSFEPRTTSSRPAVSSLIDQWERSSRVSARKSVDLGDPRNRRASARSGFGLAGDPEQLSRLAAEQVEKKYVPLLAARDDEIGRLREELKRVEVRYREDVLKVKEEARSRLKAYRMQASDVSPQLKHLTSENMDLRRDLERRKRDFEIVSEREHKRIAEVNELQTALQETEQARAAFEQRVIEQTEEVRELRNVEANVREYELRYRTLKEQYEQSEAARVHMQRERDAVHNELDHLRMMKVDVGGGGAMSSSGGDHENRGDGRDANGSGRKQGRETVLSVDYQESSSSSSSEPEENRRKSAGLGGLFGLPLPFGGGGGSSSSGRKSSSPGREKGRFSPHSRVSASERQLQEELSRQKRMVSNLSQEVEQYQSQISVIQLDNEQFQELQRENKVLKKERDTIAQKLSHSTTQQPALEEENQELRRRTETAEKRWQDVKAVKEKEARSLADEVKKLTEEMKQARKERVDLQSQIDYWKKRAVEGKPSLNDISTDLADDGGGMNSPQASTIARIQQEREKLIGKLDKLNKRQEDAQNTLDKDRLIGDSMWLRNLPVATSAAPASASKPRPKHQFKVANLLEGEELNLSGNDETASSSSSAQPRSRAAGPAGPSDTAIFSPDSNRPARPPDPSDHGRQAKTSSPGGAPSAQPRDRPPDDADLPPSHNLSPRELENLKKQAFRAVGRDDEEELLQLLKQVGSCKVWLSWVNGGGDTLLKMADLRKREKTLHLLRKSMGVAELVSTERDNIWVFRELGDPQPEQATVKGVMPSETGDPKDSLVFVEYWSGKIKDEYIPAVRCRLMLNNSWEIM